MISKWVFILNSDIVQWNVHTVVSLLYNVLFFKTTFIKSSVQALYHAVLRSIHTKD